MIRELQRVVASTLESVVDGALRIEIPSSQRGEFAVCCAPLAQSMACAQDSIARLIADALSVCSIVQSVEVTGPYVNIRIRADALFSAAMQSAAMPNVRAQVPQRIMVEYLSPNTNKPLHLGHVRNGVLGSTLANLLEITGHTVTRAILINDRGEHICKSMLAYQMFGNGATPDSVQRKGDHFVGDWYVRYAQAEKEDPAIKDQIARMLEQWESGDQSVRALWGTMNDWVYTGFDVTNARYGFRFDIRYFESELYQLGKDVVYQGLRDGIFFVADDGSIRFLLSVEEFGTNPEGEQRKPKVLNANGTSIYLTQDLGTAIRKANEFCLDRSVYVVGSEQDPYFKTLFAILKALGYPWAEQCYHLSYGMVDLQSGKMKSREGTVVDADNLANDMTKMAKDVICANNPHLDQDEVERRAECIGLAAIKFYLLRYDRKRRAIFLPEASLSFEGDTGPYCLYAYARARSIIRRAQNNGTRVSLLDGIDFEILDSNEGRACAMEILRLPDGVRKAAEVYAPSILAERLLGLAKAFNRFYR